MKKITIDTKKCIGCGLCASLANKTFKLNNRGKAEVIGVKTDSYRSVREAIVSCPVGAITED